jgi:hypothetical protein
MHVLPGEFFVVKNCKQKYNESQYIQAVPATAIDFSRSVALKPVLQGAARVRLRIVFRLHRGCLVQVVSIGHIFGAVMVSHEGGR